MQVVDAQRHQRRAPGVFHAGVAVGEAGLHLGPGQGFRLLYRFLRFLYAAVEVAHVGAGAEGGRGAGDQQHAALRVVLEAVQLGADFGGHLRPQGVACGRVVHGEHQHALAVFRLDVFVGHQP